MNSEYIRIILAYQYFSLLINKKVYHFVPIEGQEILINRRTKQVINTETKFAFQKGKDIIYITIKKLTTLEEFMAQIEQIIKPYYNTKDTEELEGEEVSLLIKELELQNIKRLIDKTLDRSEERRVGKKNKENTE